MLCALQRHHLALGAAAATAVWLLRQWSKDAMCQERDDTDVWMSLCHDKRTARAVKPSQSSFRVTAVVVFSVNGSGARAIVGHNDEACKSKADRTSARPSERVLLLTMPHCCRLSTQFLLRGEMRLSAARRH